MLYVACTHAATRTLCPCIKAAGDVGKQLGADYLTVVGVISIVRLVDGDALCSGASTQHTRLSLRSTSRHSLSSMDDCIEIATTTFAHVILGNTPGATSDSDRCLIAQFWLQSLFHGQCTKQGAQIDISVRTALQ